ncbi:hypothetical protein [Marinoscillum sp. MHG1-6]|uniref:hypothetical protein n=1 Tax=Marinoscillum sp. MHG1-6 TaxID=2959627 RepID=UPI00215869AD|nr:hypothetical protein [Marinoscillum sp. MHG1-6]
MSSNLLAQLSGTRYPQLKETLTPFRLPMAHPDSISYIFLDDDKDPDGIKATLLNGKKVLWIDDDDDMKIGDLEGDMDNDALLIDINNDGLYSDEEDIILDYLDEDGDGKADYMALLENGLREFETEWLTCHYIWMIDEDQDGVFGHMNWDTFTFEAWDHAGRANFFTDYNGDAILLKAHNEPWNMENLSYNWENPFLHFDEDNDGLSEMAIRMLDRPQAIENTKDFITLKFSESVSSVQMGFDLDNDTEPGNELDFDMSLKFSGKGFQYQDQVHPFKSHPIAEGSDQFFTDPRYRHLTELIYPGRENAYDLTFDRGEWEYCWFVFDEDDDCNRWERVEFYDPKDPFKIGSGNGGLDDNPQADAAGDRGEWDSDFSGKGNLYISPLDGKIHLYGAETGYWRIDQHALFFQGWQGWRGDNLQPEDTDPVEPERFATVKYEDTDNNGFFDKISYDMDGDQVFEESFSLCDAKQPDKGEIFVTADMEYEDYSNLFNKVARVQSTKAVQMLALARQAGLNTDYYNFYKNPRSVNEQYNHGYWLSYYLLRDIKQLKVINPKVKGIDEDRVYYSLPEWTRDL